LSPVHPGTLAVLPGSVALVWWVFPLIAIGGAGRSTACGRIGILIAVVALLARLAWPRARGAAAAQRNAALLKGLKQPARRQPSKEAEVLAKRFDEAMAMLKLRASPGAGPVSGAGAYLYELPWYMFIGAPGSGKTTALLNSGLQFPLATASAAARRSRASAARATATGGSPSEAVLIDTAGRYTTQESDREVDASGLDRASSRC
jgi:type VI secretion system protein ImpL